MIVLIRLEHRTAQDGGSEEQLGPELFLQRKTLERVFIYLNRSTHSRLRSDITCLSVRYTECKMVHSKLYKCQQC